MVRRCDECGHSAETFILDELHLEIAGVIAHPIQCTGWVYDLMFYGDAFCRGGGLFFWADSLGTPAFHRPALPTLVRKKEK